MNRTHGDEGFVLPIRLVIRYWLPTGKSCAYVNAAEQKARTTYDNILRLVKDPEVCDPIRFLRQREVVHFQRFGEGLRIVTDKLNEKNFYAFNPEFDSKTAEC